MNVSLKQFLQSGLFGDISLGMSAEDVLTCLGPPDGRKPELKKWNDTHWMYGNLMLTFRPKAERCQGVWIILWHPLEGEALLPSACIVEDWDITTEIKPKELKTYLRDNGIEFRYRSAGGFQTFSLPSGVKIGFADHRLSEMLVHGNP